MSRSPNQKPKLLYLMQFLLQPSDEDYPVKVTQYKEHLKRTLALY